MLKNNNALALQLRNLRLPVLLPVFDIGGSKRAERATCPKGTLYGGIEAGVDDSTGIPLVSSEITLGFEA